MKDITILGEIRLDEIPDEAIEEFKTRQGGVGLAIKFKLRSLREPDPWGNQYTVLVEYGSDNDRQKTYIGKGRDAPWGQQQAQAAPVKNKWRTRAQDAENAVESEETPF